MNNFRLSGDIVPQSYNLEIIADLDESNFNFTGTVLIKVLCLKSIKSIILHSSELIISEDKVYIKEDTSSEDKTLTIKQHVYNVDNQFYCIDLENNLNHNKSYDLFIPFKGNLSAGLVGFYKSQYLDKASNTIKWMASTHFEPIYARKAFPCFDEPHMKATFKIKLGHKETFNSLSNMPIVKTYPMQNKNGWVWSEFQETVKMSTYLIAYAIGSIEFKEAKAKSNKITFRVWSRPDLLDQLDFSKEFGSNVLEYFEEYFNIKYPLPKLDMIAIPDFSIGAMENWGLITYRDAALLYNEKGSSIRDKQEISYVIAHEISHQWFGNLVTMKWWTDLWLKEGFATFLGNLGVNKLFPEWNFLDEAVMNVLQNVYKLDSLSSSHPVSVEINKPSEIAQIFDRISYDKGSMIIHMMGNFLGKSLQPGLRDYLLQHEYDNAAQDDLWKALTSGAQEHGTLKSNMTVKDVMDSWTLQTGFPLVTVDRDYDKGIITVSQKRYYLGKSLNDCVSKQLWKIPLTYTTLSEHNFVDTSTKHWFNKENDVIKVEIKPDDWIIFNVAVAGLYRVQYDTKNWKMIIDTLNSTNCTLISPINRANLLLDAFDLAWKGDLNYVVPLEMAKYLNKDSLYVELSVGLNKLNAIGKLLVKTPAYGHYSSYVRNLIGPIYAHYDNLLDDKNETRIHSLVTDWACTFNVGNCCNQVLQLFKQWQNSKLPDDHNPVPTAVRRVVYATAVRHGDSDVWNFLWERYKQSNYASEKNTILSALACSKDMWILERYLEWSILENSGIRRQDADAVYAAVVRESIGGQVAINFFQRNIGDIIKYHSEKGEMVKNYLLSSAEYFIHQYDIKKWKEFIDAHTDLLKDASLAAIQSVDIAQAQGAWYDLHYSKMAQLLTT